jgi:zinc protease
MVRRPNRRYAPESVHDLPVHERTLANGLHALVLPRGRTPIVVCDLYYPAGSFDEPSGRTGLAHFVEHMLFKGTEHFPKGQIDRFVLTAAGQSNAETGEDSTHYWFAFPADRWELALAIEADRMRGARFDPREVEAERQVICEERARELASAPARLDQTHGTVTYLRHPYRNPIVGWPDDIARISVDDLVSFYHTHYRPDGAVLVVVGDVDPDRALDAIERHFAKLAPGKAPQPRPSVVEPAQNGRRYFELSEPGSAPRGLLGWRTVPRGHPDAPALDVVADLLSSGRRARLWRSLVETDKSCTWVDAGHAVSQRGGQFFVQIEAVADAGGAAVERRIVADLLRLGQTGPSAQELARSRRRLVAAWRWEQEDMTSLAAGLGNAAVWNDWQLWPAEHRAALAVTAADIRRVVGAYLVEANLTVGWTSPRADLVDHPAALSAGPSIESFLPGGPAQRALSGRRGAGIGAVGSPLFSGVRTPRPAPAKVPLKTCRFVDFHPCRTVLDNGFRVIWERRPDTGVIALELYVDAGIVREAKPGLACLTGRLLEEGTLNRSAHDLAATIEDAGGSLDVASTGGSVRVCREELAIALEILADVAIRPAFPRDAMDWVARRITADLRGDLEDPAFRADLRFRELVYGDHPLARDPRGGPGEIATLSRRDVVAHHRRHFTPENAFLVAVGDFDPRRLCNLVKAQFGDWAGGRRPLPPLPRVPKPGRPRVRRIPHASEQVQIIMGHLGVPRTSPDFDALVVLDHIFGSGPGFSDRLSRILRDELGLVYAVGGGMTDSADVLSGLFRVYAATRAEHADRVMDTIAAQLRAMHAGAFSNDEVDRARRYLAAAWVFDYQTVEQRAERLLDLERWGLCLDEPKHWPERIASITPAQVRSAASVHLHPDALFRVELGPVRVRGQEVQAECA